MIMESEAAIRKEFFYVPNDELEALITKFNETDIDADGLLDSAELMKLCRNMLKDQKYEEILKMSKELSIKEASMRDFLNLVTRLKQYGPSSTSNCSTPPRKSLITKIGGATESSQHSIDPEELEQFVHHINQIMQNDSDVADRVPINPKSNQLFERCHDGIILSKLINDSAPETIDERVLNMGKTLNPFQMTENNNLVINSAKAIGCNIVNIGSQDLIEGREHLILGLIWQVIKVGLLAKVNLQLHPELYRLLEQGESLDTLLKLPADELLLRWFNYHLKKAGWNRQVTNFSADIKDSANYIILLNQLSPEHCDKIGLQEEDLGKRAEIVLQNAAKMGCRKYVSVKAIIEGNPKLNLAFVANLFNLYPGLAPLDEKEMANLDDALFASQGDREARAFALWMNSLGVDPFVNYLYEDLKDGRILLQTIDKVRPGSVNWKRANIKSPLSRFKCIENTNYVIELGRQLNFSLVGIQGADLTDGSKTLTLALVWQLMRDHIFMMLKTISKGDKAISDADIIDWANNLVNSSGKDNHINSFKDASIKTGCFLIDLLEAMSTGIINYDLVKISNEGDEINDEDCKNNAKYAISVARKLGATIFLLPEDIVEIKPKMIMTFIGSLMAIHSSKSHNQ